RWETPDGSVYSYLYLQINPAVWWTSFLGVLIACSLLAASMLFGLKQKMNNPKQLLIFLGIYVSYMIAIAKINRVMYLYHYFIPLVLSFLILSLIIMEIRTIGPWKTDERRRRMLLTGLAALIVMGFVYY